MSLFVLLAGLLFVYLFFLNKHLSGPTDSGPSQLSDNSDDSKVPYTEIDLLEGVPPATKKGYAIIGGSGFLGRYLIRLLLLRGEENIRVIDLNPPDSSISSHAAVSFVCADIRDPVSIRDALLQPFDSTGSPPTVIYHTAAIIRFWERSYYTWRFSYGINVLGTKNIVNAVKEIRGATLIYTSSGDAVIPSSKLCRLGFEKNYHPWNKPTISDNDPPLGPWETHDSCYARTKILAERLIIEANSQNGLKTGIIRPGYTIVGPNDRLCTSTLTMPRVPEFGKRYRHTNICAWDAVTAHLLLEDALTRIPEETAGQAFLVTGKGAVWSLGEIRKRIKDISTRLVVLDDVPDLLIFILAHLVEAFLFIRYHVLLPFYFLVGGTLRPDPKWMGETVYLQPATLEFMADITIDDSRARKVLGYKPKWAPEQWIRYTVDEVLSGKTHGGHGLQLKSI